MPFTIVVEGFYFEAFEHAFREAKACVVVIEASKECRRDVEYGWVAFCIFSVEVAVYNQAKLRKTGLFIKGVGDRTIAHSPISVVVSPYFPLNTIE